MLSSHWSKFLPILGMKRELSSALAKQDGFWSHVTSQHMQPLSSHPYLARLVNYYANIQKFGMLQHSFNSHLQTWKVLSCFHIISISFGVAVFFNELHYS